MLPYEDTEHRQIAEGLLVATRTVTTRGNHSAEISGGVDSRDTDSREAVDGLLRGR